MQENTRQRLTGAVAVCLVAIAFMTVSRALGTPVAVAVPMIGVATAFAKFNETAGQVLGEELVHDDEIAALLARLDRM